MKDNVSRKATGEMAKRSRLAFERNVEWAKYLSRRADVRTHDGHL